MYTWLTLGLAVLCLIEAAEGAYRSIRGNEPIY